MPGIPGVGSQLKMIGMTDPAADGMPPGFMPPGGLPQGSPQQGGQDELLRLIRKLLAGGAGPMGPGGPQQQQQQQIQYPTPVSAQIGGMVSGDMGGMIKQLKGKFD